MNETKIKGVLESVNWVFGSGGCTINLVGDPQKYHGGQRQIYNILEENLVSIGDTVIVTVNDIGMMTSIRHAPVCPKCGSTEVEEERVNACLCYQCVCVSCGHSWIEE